MKKMPSGKGNKALSLLFVDDEPLILKALNSYLRIKQEIWKIEFASSGQEALDKLDAQPFDIVICDMKMPFMDGEQLFRKMREAHPGVKRVLMSGGGIPDDLQGLFHAFIPKPCSRNDLLETIEKVTGQSQKAAPAPKMDKRPVPRLKDRLALSLTMNERPSILFIDDEPSLLKGIEQALRGQRKRWDMTFALGAEEGLRTLAEKEFDTVILDVNMPGKTGFEVLDLIREREATKELPVVMLTGISDSTIKRTALARGADDLLAKPIQREDLVARIDSMLRIKAYQDHMRNQNDVLDRKVRERTRDLEQTQLDIIWRLAKAAEYRDDDTGNHIIRVAHYCSVIAENLGLNLDFVERLYLTSPLHDMGKIGIPDNILLKPGSLDPDEWEMMRTHSQIGAAILDVGLVPSWTLLAHQKLIGRHREATAVVQINPLLEMAAIIARTHHEKWDGRGYPEGLKGEAIPLEGRITAVADVFDALTSNRPYKKAMDREKATGILREGRGSHFDPAVIDAFDATRNRFYTILDKWGDKP